MPWKWDNASRSARLERLPVVLLAEPHPDTRDLYRAYFHYHDVQTIAAATADEVMGLALIAGQGTNIVVTSTTLVGEADGIDLVVRLRRHARTQHTPIIVVGAQPYSEDEQRAREAGCDHFVVKPCPPEVLLDHVLRLSRTARASRRKPW